MSWLFSCALKNLSRQQCDEKRAEKRRLCNAYVRFSIDRLVNLKDRIVEGRHHEVSVFCKSSEVTKFRFSLKSLCQDLEIRNYLVNMKYSLEFLRLSSLAESFSFKRCDIFIYINGNFDLTFSCFQVSNEVRSTISCFERKPKSKTFLCTKSILCFEFFTSQ